MRKIWIYAICGLGLILGPTQLQAQPLVSGPTLELSEIFGRISSQVEVGDVNGDGELDILVDEGVLVLADGAGGFEPLRLVEFSPFTQFSPQAIALNDLNGDGLSDVVAATSGRELLVFFGDAEDTLRFANFAPLQLNEGTATVEVADFNGDGRRDVAVVSRNSKIDLFLNDGSGSLAAAAGIEFVAENIRLSTTGDINNDDISDIAVVDPFSDPNEILIFLGDGSGGFSEAPGSGLIFNNADESFPSSANTVELHDMNQDGNLDLVGLSINPSKVAVFSGDGTGNFLEIEGSPFSFNEFDVPEFLRIGDMNSDGIPDVVTGNRVRSVSVLTNDGDGALIEILDSPFPAKDSVTHIALGDIDNDGNLDAVTANGSRDLSLFRGDGGGSLLLAPISPLILDTDPNSLVIRDMTNDGILDLLFLRETQDELIFSNGLGDGLFGQLESFSVGDRPSSLAVGDLDTDGNLDVLVGLNEFNDQGIDTENGDVSVLLGDGTGNFISVLQSGLPEDFGTIDLAMTEFDGNSSPDLLVRTFTGIRLFAGNGDGTFSDFDLIETSDSSTTGILSIDVNQDGFLDIVTGFQSSFQGPEDLAIFLGSASGDFTEAASSPVFVAGVGIEEIRSSDFNQDGMPDLATANVDGSVTVLMNTGNAEFDSSTVFSPSSAGMGRLAVGEFNADGNPDLLLAFFTGSGTDYQVLMGDGNGQFTEDTGGPFSVDSTVLSLDTGLIDSDDITDAGFLERTRSFPSPSKYRIQTLLSTRAQAEVSPTIVDFSEVQVGETSSQQDVVISSAGDRGLVVGSVALTGMDPLQFAIESDACSGEVISPGTDCMISIVFSPLEPGAKEAGLEILSNADTSPDSVALSGDAILVNQPFLDLTPEEVDFGEVAIGGSSNRTTTVENTGTAALNIGNLSLSGSAADDYTLNVDNCSSTTLEPGETCTYNVGVAPSQTGLREALVEIPSNAFSSPDQQPYSATGIEAPVITFVPDGFDFGQVAVGTTETSPDLLVENSGSADLVIDELQLQGTDAPEFDLASDECSGQVLPIGAQCAFTVSFSPTAVGFNGPAVAVISNAVPSPRFFIMSGEGVLDNPELDLMPDSIDFGNVAGDGVADAASVIFSNPGIGPLEVTAVDPAEAPFIQAGGTCGAVPFSVAAGDSCTIDYQFQPTDPGDFAQTITVDSDAIAGSDTEFSLTGTSGQFNVAVMKSNAAEFVLPGVATIYDIQVLNLGLSDLFGVEIVDILPPELDAIAATWTCTPGTGVACPIDSGTGDISEFVDLPAGAGMAFTLVAPVIAEEGVDVVNTVTATMPAGIEDEDPSNNEATDSDPVAIFAGDFEFAGCSDDLIENRFCVTGENVVLDIVTGLEWQRCPFGRVWDETNQTCTGDASGVEWDDAVLLAPDGGWRLPSVEELSTLRYCSDGDPALFLPSVSGPGIRCNNVGDIIQPVIEPEAFPNWPLNAPVGPPWFWTTTDGPDFEDSDGNIIDGKIAVSFGEGSILNVNKVSPIQVLLVRD